MNKINLIEEGHKMVKRLPFPVILAEGNPYEVGYQYGSQCKALIVKMLDMYGTIFKRNANLGWNEVLALARKFMPFIENYDPDAMEEMTGVAKGVGVSLEDIVAINARTEMAFVGMAGTVTEESPQETYCTTLAATPEATQNGHTLIGQNWDWYPEAQKAFILLKKRKKGKPNCVSFIEAGLLGKGGLNSAGLGFVGNAMATDKMRVGVPTHIITNRILNAESLTEVIGMLLSAYRAGATNRLTATANGECADIELSTDDYSVIFPEDGVIAHTNHFTVQKPTIRDTFPNKYPSTFTRLHRAKKLLAAERGHITLETFERILRDHLGKPDSICWHLDERIDKSLRLQTNASIIMDLNEKAFYIAKGPPCQNEYVALDLKDIL